MAETIEFDCRTGEAGGQVLRTAVALAALKGQPIHLLNIRAGREQPGLKQQHLAALQTISSICSAELKGAKLGSTEITFAPKQINSMQLAVNIGTAGSISLLLQQL